MYFGDGEESPASLDDMVALPTGEALFGKASDREAGLTIFFMSYIRLVTTFMQIVLACRTKRWQNLACPRFTWKRHFGTCFSSLPHRTIYHWTC